MLPRWHHVNWAQMLRPVLALSWLLLSGLVSAILVDYTRPGAVLPRIFRTRVGRVEM